ncbi:MAG: hypothetical protein JST04_12870 [Bdellovibrionales bacterium]|nr:hypothetical protein [Bdellovibrionales bacterium]
MNTEIQKKLTELAYKKTIPFCYGDYIECPKGVCPKCGSDDLMRFLPGVGVEYGTAWVIKHILSEGLASVDLDEAFENSMRDCYPETTTIGFLKDYDTVNAMKELDPVGWRCAQADWESFEANDGNIISFDNGATYYQVSDIEGLIEEI